MANTAPTIAPTTDTRTKQQPRYNGITGNDEDHTFGYVIDMLQELFGFPPEKGFTIASQVDEDGKAVCLTTTLEHAELKRDQIHAFGNDPFVSECQGSMSATIEPLE
ncbi:MAG: ATP-dependent Clp protease adaptor ClpS [Planctomycetes bacterium]|nr:ATP-dependent Clp protease adaptor ClpS [Planctomycetota bacterium]